MKKFTKILSAMLALLLLISAMAFVTSCKKDGETEKSETVSRGYFTVVTNGESNVKGLSEFLVGKQVGVNLGDVTVDETAGEITTAYTYKNVKVESIVKDNSTATVADGGKVFVTYTITFNAEPWLNEETGKYELPAGFLDTNIDAEGKYSETFTMDVLDVVADAELPEGATAEEKEAAKTFLGQLVGKSVGTTSTITVKNGTVGDKTVEIKYTGVKVNWIVNSEMNPFTVKFTPYEEELKEDNSNKKTETSVKGEKVILEVCSRIHKVISFISDFRIFIVRKPFCSCFLIICIGTKCPDHC